MKIDTRKVAGAIYKFVRRVVRVMHRLCFGLLRKLPYYHSLVLLFRPRLGMLYQYPPRPMREGMVDIRHPSATACQDIVLPTISIVTPSFNQGAYIEETIQSVLDQKYPKLEYVIQDGGSKDNTVAILEKYSAQLSAWESKADSGQTNAINKGFLLTTSDIMGWLNSDDILLPGTLHTVGRYFAMHPEVDVIYGNRVLIDADSMEVGRWILPNHDHHILTWVDYVPQETLFWRRSLWEKIGSGLDESFRFAMDWDLLIRFREIGACFVHIPQFFGAFRVHQAQKTSSMINDIGLQEMTRIRERLLGYVPSYYKIRYKSMKYLLKHILIDMRYRLKRV
jgi:glycosyltransferase involved in cell wall biosynthesis